MELNKEDIGIHLILDIIVDDIINPDICCVEVLENYIKSCIEIAELDILGEIVTHKLNVENSDLVGITSIATLTTSHISLHTWPEHNYISIDLYSCKYFNLEKIIELTKKYFNTKTMDIVEVERGINMPQKINSWVVL